MFHYLQSVLYLYQFFGALMNLMKINIIYYLNKILFFFIII